MQHFRELLLVETLKTPNSVCFTTTVTHWYCVPGAHSDSVILKFFIPESHKPQNRCTEVLFISWELLQVLSHVRTKITIYHFNTNPCLAQKLVQ